MMGNKVRVSLEGTISMNPKAGLCKVSAIPNTHTSLLVALPQ